MGRHVPARDKKSLAPARVFADRAAYLLALNAVLAGFGSASGGLIGRDQGSPFANIICAAAAVASDIGGDPGAPGKSHAHHAHHCIVCCASAQAAAPDQTAILPVDARPPAGPSGAAKPSPRSNAALLFDTGFMSSRSSRAPPLTV
jgi:hypothetical protein